MVWQILLLIMLFSIVYYSLRYVPPKGIDQLSQSSLAGLTETNNKPLVIDVREFHDAKRDPVRHSINIPLPYLKRHYPRENQHPIHIVAKDSVEINLSARFLKKKGFDVTGCTRMYPCVDSEDKAEKKRQTVCSEVQ